jgi:type IV pilus assembly protein PilX
MIAACDSGRTRGMRRQRGMSLLIVLLFLAIMLGLGTTAIRTATLEQQVTGSERDRQVAFEAAEAALRDGERLVQQSLQPGATFGSGFDANCSHGQCLPATTGVPQWRSIDWRGTAPIDYGRASGAGAYPLTGLAATPRYIIERLPPLTPTDAVPFRITAVGWGRRVATQVMLQSVYLPGTAAAGRRISWRQER